MTAPAPAGADASNGSAQSWKSIDWTKVESEVKRQQMRIAKAVREGRYRKASALQWLLTCSFSAKALAVRQVTTNKGAKTPGVDGKIWRSDQQKLKAALSLRRRGYQPQPLRRLYIPKRSGGKRPLSIPTMHDRAMQALHALALRPVAETLADRNSYGFREGRSCADAIGQCYIALAKSYSAPWVLEADIQSCFDEISHGWLMANIPMDRMILRKWLKAGFRENGARYPTEAGTPQGGIISPLLANMTLDGLEKAVLDTAPRRGDKVNVIRYADDFIVTCERKELLEEQVKPAIATFLQKRGLKLSEKKTAITHIRDGLDFLSQNLRKYGTTLLITPAKKAIRSLRDKIRQVIRKHLGAPAQALIVKLNPILRGWANYHRHVCAKRHFAAMDRFVYGALHRWAKHRHPTKTNGWRRRKYFTADGQEGDFCAPAAHRDGESRFVKLHRMARTKIERHIKVRGEANPYDPQYTDYFEKRKIFAWRVRPEKRAGQPA